MTTWPQWHSGANRQVGETQLSLLAEAAARPSGQLMLDAARDNARWCAMKRMVQRGLFNRQQIGSDFAPLGSVVIYTITDAGHKKLNESRASVKIKGAGS